MGEKQLHHRHRPAAKMDQNITKMQQYVGKSRPFLSFTADLESLPDVAIQRFYRGH